jgi:hypothetical protein
MSWATTKPWRFGGKHLDYFHTEITPETSGFSSSNTLPVVVHYKEKPLSF